MTIWLKQDFWCDTGKCLVRNAAVATIGWQSMLYKYCKVFCAPHIRANNTPTLVLVIVKEVAWHYEWNILANTHYISCILTSSECKRSSKFSSTEFLWKVALQIWWWSGKYQTFDNLRGHVKPVSWMLERHATSLTGNCLLSLTICTHLCSKHNFTNDVGDNNHTCVLRERTKLQ